MSALRFRTLVCCLALIPLGFGFKYYAGPGACWANPYGAAVLYEIFWCCAAFFFFPSRRNIPVIAAAVFFITCALESMQLWHPPLLEAVRRSLPGAWLIGTSFDWLDFPHYLLGSALGYTAMTILDKR